MWLTKKTARRNRDCAPAAESAVVTLGTGSVAAYGRGEQRELSLLSPKGVLWRPETGDRVLTLQGEPGSPPCLAGELNLPQAELAPGELLLRSKGASIRLRNDGVIEIRGTVVYPEEQEET